jgi:hypothetical protein
LALSSPVGSSPDEDYHLASIWCGQGVGNGDCEAGSVPSERRVPESLTHAAPCYAFHGDISARCQSEWFFTESTNLVETARGNFSGEYPPVFYYTMHFFVGDDISKSVIAMRLANAALFVGLLSVVYRLLPRHRRTMLLLGSAVALVPLGVFIIPSVNPSSWAMTACAVAFPATVGYFQTEGRRRAGLAAVMALATLIAGGARADAAVYVALAVVLAALVAAPWRSGLWKMLIFPALVCVACLLSYLSSGQGDAVLPGTTGPDVTDAYRIGYNLLNVPELWVGALGSWSLGWLDTPMPSVVWVANLAVFSAVAWSGMRNVSARKAVALALALVAAWLIPTYVLVKSSTIVGFQVQPRYLLPLLILLAQVALFRARPAGERTTRGHLLAAATVLTATNAISLHANMRRYVTGTDVFDFNLDHEGEWWWSFPLSPMVLWSLGSICAATALVLCVRALRSAERDLSESAPESEDQSGPAEARRLVGAGVSVGRPASGAHELTAEEGTATSLIRW